MATETPAADSALVLAVVVGVSALHLLVFAESGSSAGNSLLRNLSFSQFVFTFLCCYLGI